MYRELLRLSRQTLTYGLGHVLTRMVAFFLLPVFTHQLLPDEYSTYVLFYIAIGLGIEFVRLGLDVALLRYYVLEKDQARRDAVFSTVSWTALIFTTGIALAVWLTPDFWLNLIITSTDVHPDWMYHTLRLSVIIMWFDNLSAFPMVIMRADNRAWTFSSIKLIGALLQVGAIVVMLIVFDRGVAGIFEGNLISSACVMLMCLPTILSRLKPIIDRSIISVCLKFGLPNLPNALFVLMIELADRKILELLRSPTEVGIYSAGYRLGMFLSIVAMAFRFAWQPFFLQVSDRIDAKKIYARVMTYYMVIVIWLYLLLTAFVRPLLMWNIPGVGPIINPAYWEGLDIFPIVLLAHVFNGIWAILMVGVYLKNKMYVLPFITGIAAVINIVGNLLLVPAYGMWACAWLTVVSYATVALLLYAYINRVYKIDYEWKRLSHISLVGLGMFAAGYIGRDNNIEWIGFTMSIIFPTILIATGFLNREEKAKLHF